MSALSAEVLRALFGERGVYLARCGSTNREAMALGRAGAPHGTVVVADAQDGGRGRQGRSWHMEPGKDLALSLVLRPRIPAPFAPMLCFAAGAALAEALDLRLKWPNDLVDHRGRKVSGMLAELELRGAEIDFAVLGVGVNVNQLEFPPELVQAGSLAQTRGPQDRAPLLARVVPAILARTAEVPAGNAAILDAWRSRGATLGRRVLCDGVVGEAEALLDDGALLLRLPDGSSRVLHTGDVELVG